MDEEKKEDRNCIECKRGGEGGAEKKTGEEIKWTIKMERYIIKGKDLWIMKNCRKLKKRN